jgi:hypothetical protein
MLQEERSNLPDSGKTDDSDPGATPQDDPRWLDRPGSVGVLIKLLIAACTLTVLVDPFYYKHGEYGFQEWPGFDALYGFVSCVSLVLVAKVLRVLMMRSEDYYD